MRARLLLESAAIEIYTRDCHPREECVYGMRESYQRAIVLDIEDGCTSWDGCEEWCIELKVVLMLIIYFVKLMLK